MYTVVALQNLLQGPDFYTINSMSNDLYVILLLVSSETKKLEGYLELHSGTAPIASDFIRYKSAYMFALPVT